MGKVHIEQLNENNRNASWIPKVFRLSQENQHQLCFLINESDREISLTVSLSHLSLCCSLSHYFYYVLFHMQWHSVIVQVHSVARASILNYSNIKVTAVVKTDGSQCVYVTHIASIAFSLWALSSAVYENHYEAILIKRSLSAALWYGRLARRFIFFSQGNDSFNTHYWRCEWKGCWVFLKGFYIFVSVRPSWGLPQVVIPVDGITSARWHAAVWEKEVFS